MHDDIERHGFSEAALRRLDELESSFAPIESYDAPPPPAAAPQAAESRPDEAIPGGAPGWRSNPAPHYWGHRERLRTRFLDNGHESLPEYELLELLLFNAIERRDVKPLAKRLIALFGDLNGVVAAPELRLREVDGVTDKVILQLRLVQAFGHRMARAKVIKREVIGSWEALMSYCKTVMAYRETEQFRILYLDRKNVLIADEAQGSGTVDHVPVYPREVAKRALELNASAIILVHNHPSGDPEPSPQDIAMTMKIDAACGAVGVTIHDHIVIGKAEDASFRALGLLE